MTLPPKSPRLKLFKRLSTSRTGPRLTASEIVSSGRSWLALALDDMHADRRPLWGEPRAGAWHPSALGEPCDRLLVLSMLGYRGEAILPKLQRIFDAGNDIEARWLNRFTELGILLGSQVPVKRDIPPMISGKADALITHPYEMTRRLVVEIKSINSNGFRQLPPVSLDHEVNYHNLMALPTYIGNRIRKYMYQLQVYLVEGCGQATEGLLLFDNKDTQDFAEYSLLPNPELIAEKYANLIKLDGYRAMLTVPPCTCVSRDRGNVVCGYREAEVLPLTEVQSMTLRVAPQQAF